MKKLLLGALALTTVLTSCNTNSSDESNYYVILLKSMETTKKAQPPVKKEYGYAEFGASRPNETNSFTKPPLLKEQKIQGGPVSRIVYDYSATAIERATTTIGATVIDSLKLNDKGMAFQIYVDEKPQPYSIEYNTDGYRTKVGDVVLTVEGRVYKNATENGVTVATYEYSNNVNRLNLQQFGIYGVENDWTTDRFGIQSLYLLSSCKLLEKGEMVDYVFSYEIDGNGLVTKEKISRKGEDFSETKFTYTIGNVTIKG